jgi:dCTP deaminase
MASPRKSGILPFQQLRTLVRQGAIRSEVPITQEQIQPASLDLRLGTKAYRLLSSFLPEPSDQQAQFTIEDLYRSDLVMYDMDLSDGAILEKGHVYLVPLMERLKLPKDVRGRTNPKSSTGRLDIFTRVVTDLHVGFDEVRAGYQGPLFLEIVPRSFTIRVHAGLALNQLRLMSGKPLVSDTSLRAVHRKTSLLCHNGEDGQSDRPLPVKDLRVDKGLFLRVDLRGNADEGQAIVGYRAKKNSHIIDLSKIGH